jgi:ATP-dependent Clp protease ATP-binding subunit ClpA
LISLKDNFAIILVDEAEKMHPDIIQSLLGMLND